MRLLICIVACFTLTQCGQTQESAGSDLQFKADSVTNILMDALYEPSISICVKPSKKERTAVEVAMTRTAFKTWIDRARIWFDPEIPGNISTDCGWLNDLYVTFSNDEGRAYASSNHYFSNQIVMYKAFEREPPLSDLEMQIVLNHELGHAFGLLDTYTEKGGVQLGEPASLMSCSTGVPQKDDMFGFGAIYARLYGSHVTFDSLSKTMSEKEGLIARLGGRITGTIARGCFTQQHRRVIQALGRLSLQQLRKLASLAGYGEAKSLVYLGAGTNRHPVQAKMFANILTVTFADDGRKVRDPKVEEQFLVDKDRFSEKETCNVVTADAIYNELNGNL